MNTNTLKQKAHSIIEKIMSAEKIELITSPFGYVINKQNIHANDNGLLVKCEFEGCDGESNYQITNEQLSEAVIDNNEIIFKHDNLIINLLAA